MKVSVDSTNKTLIRQGKFYPYASQVALYRCPADPSRTGDEPRVRSYSMNGWMGSRYMEGYSATQRLPHVRPRQRVDRRRAGPALGDHR